MEITGQVHVTMRNAECYGGRCIHLRLEGLPHWLLDLIFDAGPFKREALSTRMGDPGAYSVLLRSSLVVATTEPAPYLVPKGDGGPEAPDSGGTP